MKKILLLVSIFIIAIANTAFAEENYATRIDALYKLSNKSIVDNPDLSILKNYNDYDAISELSERGQEILAAMIEKGIINGYEDNTLRPKNTLTRAEYAVIIYRAHEYLDELESYGKYITNYSDIADWNKDAIDYCMEHGLMMGYGDKFGCDDLLTSSQLDTIYKRRINGLSTIDKYTVLSFKGEFPLDMVKVKASAKELIPADSSAEIQENAESYIRSFENFIDIAYSFDYTKTNSEELVNEQSQKIRNHFSIRPNIDVDPLYSIKSLLNENLKNEYSADSFFISTPELYRHISPGPYPLHDDVAEGYIYFKINNNTEQAKYNDLPVYRRHTYASPTTPIFHAAMNGRPEFNLETGKWYRQKVTVISHYDRFHVYPEVKPLGTAEEVPAELYN